jgi:polysaccharide biosynthesis protein PslG
VWQTDDITAGNGGWFDVHNTNVVAAITKDATDMQGAGVKWARMWVGPGDSVDELTTVANIFSAHNVTLELDANQGHNASPANEQAITNWLTTTVPAMSAAGVHYWEIGNEPNISADAGGYWDTCQAGITPSWANGQGDTNTAVASYVTRLKDAYTTIHHYDPKAFVSSAGLSYDPSYNAYCEIPSNDWISALTKTDAANYMDCFGIHPYGGSPDAVIGALTDTRNALNANPAYNKIPFCITETGFWANGYTPGSQNGYVGNDENNRATQYTTMMTSLKNYGITTPVFWYTWYDYNQPTGYGAVHYSGFTTRDYTPVYTAMKNYDS